MIKMSGRFCFEEEKKKCLFWMEEREAEETTPWEVLALDSEVVSSWSDLPAYPTGASNVTLGVNVHWRLWLWTNVNYILPRKL